MHAISFEDAVRSICESNDRIDRDAYYFLREALEATVGRLRGDETPEHQHVNGGELLDGFRDHALEKFGPMASTVLETWGLESTADIGRMVFDLIEAGAFGQSDEDRLEDFVDRYDFDEAFRAPFRPRRRRAGSSPVIEGETPRRAVRRARASRRESAEATGGDGPQNGEDAELS